MTRKYTKKAVITPIIEKEEAPDHNMPITFEGEMEKVEICTALFHLLPLHNLRELYRRAKKMALSTN